MKIISWNVNGIKSLIKGGYLDEIFVQNPDILCLQETKTKDELPEIDGYSYYHFPSKKTGSGVAIYTKEEILSIRNGFGIGKFDEEGRVQRVSFPNFNLFNFYSPSGANKDRLAHKFEFYDKFTEYVLKSDKPAIICGDYNRIHEVIDAKRPELIKNKSGFLPEEEQWFKEITENFIDAFRYFHKEESKYTWWPYSRNARELDNGLRLDYFLVNKKLEDMMLDSYILTNQLGSDHAPIVLELNSCPACGKLNSKNNEYCYDCGLKILEDTNDNEDNHSSVNKRKIPKDKIILLDLNYTLVSNSKTSGGRYPGRIFNQRYETELIDLIKNNYVILITARPYKYSYFTLRHIKELTDFVPNEDYWNFGLQPPQLKEYWMLNEIFNKHGDNPSKYLAIESNPKTRAMYKKLGIEAYPKQKFIDLKSN